MRRYVWKYTFPANKLEVEVPEPARLLTVRIQGPPYSRVESLVAWFEVVPEAKKQRIKLEAVNTGMAIPIGGDYLTTVEASTGIIWHVYRIPKGE